MTGDGDVRDAWLGTSSEVRAHAIAGKDSQAALGELARAYGHLAPEDRAIVDELLVEQVQSEDEAVRFDALFLVREFRIQSAIPALRALADRLERHSHPGAPHEWAKVNRILGNLVDGHE
jgi:hypothetical protein